MVMVPCSVLGSDSINCGEVVVGKRLPDISDDLVVWIVQMRPEEIVRTGVLESLDRRGERGVVFAFRAHEILDAERVLRDVVWRGHWLAVSAEESTRVAKPKPTGSPSSSRSEIQETKEDIDDISLTTREHEWRQAKTALESITGQEPTLLVRWDKALDYVPQAELNLTDELEMATLLAMDTGSFRVLRVPPEVKMKPGIPLEVVMSPTQIRCFYARMTCDEVAEHEMFYRQCQVLRREYWKRVGVDLFKYRSISSMEDAALKIDEQAISPSQHFVEHNRERIEQALRRIRRGASLREVMVILYTLSDAEIQGDTEESIAREMQFSRTWSHYLGITIGWMLIFTGVRPVILRLVRKIHIWFQQKRKRSILARAMDIGKTL